MPGLLLSEASQLRPQFTRDLWLAERAYYHMRKINLDSHLLEINSWVVGGITVGGRPG